MGKKNQANQAAPMSDCDLVAGEVMNDTPDPGSVRTSGGPALAKLQKFTMERVLRSSINPSPYNPRKITREARKALARNLKGVGLIEALVVNRVTMNLVSGHQRLSILDESQKYDRETKANDYLIDVAMISLTEIQEREQNVMMNNQSAMGTWDPAALEQLMGTPGIDLDNTGFQMVDLEAIIGNVDAIGGNLLGVKSTPEAHAMSDMLKEIGGEKGERKKGKGEKGADGKGESGSPSTSQSRESASSSSKDDGGTRAGLQFREDSSGPPMTDPRHASHPDDVLDEEYDGADDPFSGGALGEGSPVDAGDFDRSHDSADWDAAARRDFDATPVDREKRPDGSTGPRIGTPVLTPEDAAAAKAAEIAKIKELKKAHREDARAGRDPDIGLTIIFRDGADRDLFSNVCGGTDGQVYLDGRRAMAAIGFKEMEGGKKWLAESGAAKAWFDAGEGAGQEREPGQEG